MSPLTAWGPPEEPGPMVESAVATTTPHEEGAHNDAQKKWQAAAHNVVEANRLARLKKSAISLDGYKVQPTPGSTCGGIISFLIWPLVMLYTIIVIVTIIRAPLETSNQIHWSMGEGPYPMEVECTSATGCYVSNHYNGKPMETGSPAMGVPVRDDHGWDISGACIFLAEGEGVHFDVFFTGLSTDGVSVLFDPSQTKPGGPPGTGFFIQSQMNMDCGSPPLAHCVDGVIPMPSYVGAGRYTLNYVRTINETRSAEGRTRHEWFTTKTASEAEGAEFHPCYSRVLEEQPGAAAAAFQQAHVPMGPFWNQINVKSKDGLWFSIIPSTVGGAYGLLYELGALVLFLWGGFTAGFSAAKKETGKVGSEP